MTPSLAASTELDDQSKSQGPSVVPGKKICSIAVCICTFRRPEGLQRLLEELDAQIFPTVSTPTVTVIVADNSPERSAAEACETRMGKWPLVYLHEPRPGISHARNTALAAVPEQADYVAMIDDDEVPDPDWLDQLLYTAGRSGADVIVGRTSPVFPARTPEWIAATGFFPKPQEQDSLQELDPDPPAATCNVLVRAALLGKSGLNFDPSLALSGGEDKLLFQSLKLGGYRFVWAATAQVHEDIPVERANLSYMLREAYRRGCVKFRIKRQLKSRSTARSIWIALRLFFRSATGAVWALALALGNTGRGRAAWVPHALTIADCLGTISGVLHIPNRHYRPKGV